MKENVTISELFLFYRLIIVTWMVIAASVLSIPANAQSQKALQIVKQLNELVKESRSKTKISKHCTLAEGVLYIQSKEGERYGYDLRLVQHVRVRKGHNEMPFYKDIYEVFLEFDYAVSNYTPFWGILKEHDAISIKKALEQLIEQVKLESVD